MITRPPLFLCSLAILAAVTSTGCSGCDDTCDPAHDQGCFGLIIADAAPPSCIPSENPRAVDEQCGVFVSVSKKSEETETQGGSGDGTKLSPFRKFSDAIAQARIDRRPIYACGEMFKESIRVPEGITIFGGMNCASDEWRYPYLGTDGHPKKTTIAPDAGKVPLKVVMNTVIIPLPDGGRPPARISDFVFKAADAMTPGGSSIAAIVDAVELEMTRCELHAGRGAPGAAGIAPVESVGPASDPDDPAIVGNPGAASCMGGGMGNPGAEKKLNALCPVSIGGEGGKGLEDKGDPGLSGEPMADGFGIGGVGAEDPNICQAGTNGRPGTNGAHGAGAGATAKDGGTIELGGYMGVSGLDGLPGEPGQGGGGGGGAKGMLNCFGASGGSGGAGGCGGMGGGGGKFGGSSIALISLGGSLVLTGVELSSSEGGAGGDGGDGQSGGIGGHGGLSGAGVPDMGLLASCSGGDGGQGGFGGKGGGGRGGHSLGIAYLGSEPPIFGVTIAVDTAGKGGLGGDAPGNGAPGMKAPTLAFP